MRVAFLTHEPFLPPSGGGSAEAPHIVREFRRRGHRLDLFCPEFPDWRKLEEDPGLRVRLFTQWNMGRYTSFRTLKYLLYPLVLTEEIGDVVNQFRAEGDPNPGFDIIFAQHTISAVAAGRVRRRIGGRLVFNFLDYLTGFMEAWPAPFTKTGFVRALNRYEMSMPERFDAEGILTVSEPLAERFADEGCPRERICPLLYGYDSRLFTPPESPPPDDAPPVVVMHGSFDQHHLGKIARDALTMVHGLRPDVRFRFVGRETSHLRRFVREMKQRCPNIAIDCLGFVHYANMPRHLRDASVGIVPYEETEGAHCAFVAKAVEYLACGLPVVSTPLENLTFHFATEPAIRFSGFDGRSFARHITDWLAMPQAERVRIGLQASRRVAQELDWPVLARRAVDFAERVHLHAPVPWVKKEDRKRRRRS